jgi:hypothetical protein
VYVWCACVLEPGVDSVTRAPFFRFLVRTLAAGGRASESDASFSHASIPRSHAELVLRLSQRTGGLHTRLSRTATASLVSAPDRAVDAKNVGT